MPPKNYRKGNKKPKMMKKRSQYKQQKLSVNTVKKIARKEMRKQVEVKTHDYVYAPTQLYHNNYATGSFIGYILLGNTNQPSQGTGESQIIGTEYNVIGSQVYAQFSTKNDRLNTKFRFVIVRIPQGVSLANYTDVFDNITGNVLLDPLDRGRCTVLYDKIIGAKNFNPTNGTDEITICKKIWVPKQKYTVKQADNGTAAWITPKYNDVMICLAYDAFGSLVTDNIGQIQIGRRLWYVDA